MRLQGASLLSSLLLLPTYVLSQGVDLGGGIITRTNAKLYADLALDLRDIRATQDQDEILRLYLDGRNAEETAGFFFPLKKISDTMSDDTTVSTPNYLFHLYGLSGLEADNYETSKQYSDRFIRSTIASSTAMTAGAIVALDMWMFASHLLLKGVDLCAKRAAADNPDKLEDLGGGGMDEFMALWIGADQTPASTDGHSLYAWSQQAGELFSTNNPEAKVNQDLKLLYQQGAGVLSLPHACTKEDTTGVKQLWTVAQQMISKMYVPQVQMLIHSLIVEDENLAALFAMSTVPQVSQCRPSVFKRLNDALLSGNVNFAKKESIINDIEMAMVDCFGLTCEDIGNYVDSSYQCNSASTSKSKALAGYQPTTNVNGYAKIDQDILQIGILASLKSWHFARYIYEFGRNSLKDRDSDNDDYETLSLHQMAVAADRKRADPYYSYFVAYFNQVNYADIAVDEALRGEGKWTTDEQRQAVIVATCSFQIVLLYLLSELKQTVTQCRDPAFDIMETTMHPWDEVAALLVGSLEGTKEGGSSDLADGQLMFNLANSRGFQFQTLNDEGYSQVNSDLDDLLFSGKGELDALDCDNLEKTARRIEKLVVVPLVQSALRYATVAEKQTTSEGSVEAALGEVFTFSVLPILSTADPASAEAIRESMEVTEGTTPVRDGAQTVADAFGAAVVEWGIECQNLGFASGADPCVLQGGHSKARTYNRSTGFRKEGLLWLSGAATLLSVGFHLFM